LFAFYHQMKGVKNFDKNIKKPSGASTKDQVSVLVFELYLHLKPKNIELS